MCRKQAGIAIGRLCDKCVSISTLSFLAPAYHGLGWQMPTIPYQYAFFVVFPKGECVRLVLQISDITGHKESREEAKMRRRNH